MHVDIVVMCKFPCQKRSYDVEFLKTFGARQDATLAVDRFPSLCLTNIKPTTMLKLGTTLLGT